MKELYNVLLEEVEPVRFGFSNSLELSGVKEWFTKHTKLTEDQIEQVYEFFEVLMGIESLGCYIAYSDKEHYVKIPYTTKAFIENTYNQLGQKNQIGISWKPTRDDNKIEILVDGKKFAILGSGSINRKGAIKMPTALQESTSCIFINADPSERANLGEYFVGAYSQYNLRVWLPTWNGHAEALNKEFDRSRYRAAWIGCGSKACERIYSSLTEERGMKHHALKTADIDLSNMWIEMRQVWKRNLVEIGTIAPRSKEEMFDKSDILIYDKSKVKAIQDAWKALQEKPKEEGSVCNLVRQMANDGWIFGISLKQLAGSSFHLQKINFGSEKERFIRNFVKGQVDRMAMPERLNKNRRGGAKWDIEKFGEVANSLNMRFETVDGKQFLLTFRTFGNGAEDMELKSLKSGSLDGPSLGKVPRLVTSEIVKKGNDPVLTKFDKKKWLKFYNELGKAFDWLHRDSIDWGTINKNVRVDSLRIANYLKNILTNEGKEAFLSKAHEWACMGLGENDYCFPYILVKS